MVVQFAAELSKLVIWMRQITSFTCFRAKHETKSLFFLFPVIKSLGLDDLSDFSDSVVGFSVFKSVTFTHLQPIAYLKRGLKILTGIISTVSCRETAICWRIKGRCTLTWATEFRIIKNSLLIENLIKRKGATSHKLVEGLLVNLEISLKGTWSSL